MKKKTTTEDRILDAAIELFVRKGYHGTSIDDIMSKVGLTKGAFYSHFSGKDQLFMTILDGYRSNFICGLKATIDDHDGNALDKINIAINFLSRFASEHTNLCVFLTFLTTELNADVDFEPALKSVYIQYQKIISGVVKQGQKQRLLKQGLDPDLVALTFMSLHDGVLHQWMLHRQYIDGAAFVRTFREIFVSGLVCPEAAEKISAEKTRTRSAVAQERHGHTQGS